MRRNQRGEGNSTAIVALVMLALVALGVFMFYGGGLRRGGPDTNINVDIERKAEAPTAPAQ